MEADRPLEAAPAFQQAAELGDARIRQEAAYGRTLAYLRKDLTAQASVAATDAPQSRQRNAELSATILAQRALAAFRDGRYVEAILALDDRARFAPEQNDLLILRGYSYLRLGRSTDAETIFRAVQRTGGSDEATAGLAAVAEASGQFR
jgi:Flp pilus assembly protein TadD